MSKRDKKKTAPHHAPASTPPVSAPKPVAETEVDKRQDRQITWSQIGAVASIVVSLASAIFAYWAAQSAASANKIAQVAQDRAAGKIQARFEFVDDQKRDPERFKEFMRRKDGSDQLVFRIESADEPMPWAPYVRIRNT
jgi:hypothetical protein